MVPMATGFPIDTADKNVIQDCLFFLLYLATKTKATKPNLVEPIKEYLLIE